jgi:MFS family permease
MPRNGEESIPLTTDIELSEGDGSFSHQHDEVRDVEKSTNGQPAAKAKKENIPWLSLPNKDQLFILGICRLSEPLSNTCLLPYIYYLMKSIVAPDTDSPDEAQHKKISELSGILVAVFPLAQLATSMLWAKWADKYGRRPIILGALLVSAISNLGFGFSRSFWGLMFWRALAGLSNGNVGVMRTVTAEIVKERKFQTKAFLLLPLIFNAGMVFGLAVGGWLADPVTSMAWLFGPKGLLNFSSNPEGLAFAVAFPYALPAMFNFSCLAFSLALAVCGLKETLDGHEDHQDIGLRIGKLVAPCIRRRLPRRFSGYVALPTGDGPEDSFQLSSLPSTIRASSSEKPASKPPSVKKIWTRDVLCAMVSFGLLPLHNSAFMHIYPVFLSSLPAKDNANTSKVHFSGGLGLHSSSIGLYLSLFGLCGIMLQLFIYPRLQARLGTLGVLKVALYMFPITYILAPFLVLLPQSGAWRWVCIAIVTWSQIMARTLAIPSTVILLTQSAPAKGALSRIHGAGNAGASLARAVGPALGGWVYAQGIQGNMVGMVWWFYLLTVAGMALIWSFTMRRLED